jgi:hypothetical protein
MKAKILLGKSVKAKVASSIGDSVRRSAHLSACTASLDFVSTRPLIDPVWASANSVRDQVYNSMTWVIELN